MKRKDKVEIIGIAPNLPSSLNGKRTIAFI